MAGTYDLKSFGIKEVADVAFYKVGDVIIDTTTNTVKGKTQTTKPVLKFDTLKMSNLEFTGETTEARGGKGNAVLMSWDHSREATMTLEDALMSAETLAALFSSTEVDKDVGSSAVINIDAKGFPGEYSVVGQTYVKATSGGNHLLTIFIPKAKVQSEASLEMTADGDPSTLNMTLKVLRVKGDEGENGEAIPGTAEGDMIKLIITQNIANDGKDPGISLPGWKDN